MKAAEYVTYDLIGLAELIRRREVSALEVLDAAIERMDAVNPKINAVTHDMRESARKTAAGPLAGPLAGAPFLFKEHGIFVAGTATALGSDMFKDVIQPADSAYSAALRKAGLVFLGKTNVPELGLSCTTEPRATGITRNPWNLDRTPGGSSGGSSAAVAAGIVPAAHGSDAGGSIRGPASNTGTFGLKPSRGRVSLAPVNEGTGGFAVHHAVTRSVRDSAILLDLVCQPQPGDPYWLDPPARPYLEEIQRPPGPLRIAYTPKSLLGHQIDPECVAAAQAAARLCESLGHRVEEVSFPGEFPMSDFSTVVAAATAATLESEIRRRGRAIGPDEIEEMTLVYYQMGKAVTAPDYILAHRSLNAWTRRAAEWFTGYDVVLNSTMGGKALQIGALKELSLAERNALVEVYARGTMPANSTGWPAMSVPLAWSSDGTPMGIHFMAKEGGEDTLLRLAAQLEEAQPWAHRRASGVQWPERDSRAG